MIGVRVYFDTSAVAKKIVGGKSVVYLVCSIRLDLSRTIKRHVPIRV